MVLTYLHFRVLKIPLISPGRKNSGVISPTMPRLTHLDAIAGTMFSVGGWQVQQIRAVLRQERVAGEVRAEAASGTRRSWESNW